MRLIFSDCHQSVLLVLAFGRRVCFLFCDSCRGTKRGAAIRGSMAAGSVAEPPQGYLAFCGRHSDQCGRAGAYMAEFSQIPAVGAMSSGDDTVHPAPRRLPEFPARSSDWQGVSSAPPAANRSPRPTSLGSVAGTPMTASSFPAMTAALWNQLETANRVVNVGVRSVSDITHYGVQDFWELPFQGGGNAGDCEDYVLQKRQMCCWPAAFRWLLFQSPWSKPPGVRSTPSCWSAAPKATMSWTI